MKHYPPIPADLPPLKLLSARVYRDGSSFVREITWFLEGSRSCLRTTVVYCPEDSNRTRARVEVLGPDLRWKDLYQTPASEMNVNEEKLQKLPPTKVLPEERELLWYAQSIPWPRA